MVAVLGYSRAQQGCREEERDLLGNENNLSFLLLLFMSVLQLFFRVEYYTHYTEKVINKLHFLITFWGDKIPIFWTWLLVIINISL